MSSVPLRRQMREQGYTDGALGRPARWLDADYQVAWRRGDEERRAREAEKSCTGPAASGPVESPPARASKDAAADRVNRTHGPSGGATSGAGPGPTDHRAGAGRRPRPLRQRLR